MFFIVVRWGSVMYANCYYTCTIMYVMSTGAQDFLPDFEHSLQWQGVYVMQPKYSPLFSAMRKVKEWMQSARVSDHVNHSVLLITCLLVITVKLIINAGVLKYYRVVFVEYQPYTSCLCHMLVGCFWIYLLIFFFIPPSRLNRL